jgi:hypothetical protein
VANVEGKASPLNVLTPIPRWLRLYRTRVLPLAFRFAAWFSRGPGPLDKLAFIHFARWVFIPRGRFPRLAFEQPREALHYDYFLFCSNFNGTWGQYLDAFSDVISSRVNLLWLGSVKYPKSRPLTPFLRYAAYNEIDTDYYYNAYPGASTRDIKAALELNAQLQMFAGATVGLSPGDFQREYDAFLTRVQGCLGSTGAPQFGGRPDERAAAARPVAARPVEEALGTRVEMSVLPTARNGVGSARE